MDYPLDNPKALVNKLAHWCVWLLSGALEIPRLRLRYNGDLVGNSSLNFALIYFGRFPLHYITFIESLQSLKQRQVRLARTSKINGSDLVTIRTTTMTASPPGELKSNSKASEHSPGGATEAIRGCVLCKPVSKPLCTLAVPIPSLDKGGGR